MKASSEIIIPQDPTPARFLVGRYHEIALKGRNRWRFVEQLKRNLVATFADFRIGSMRGEGPRLLIGLPADLSDEIARERASLIFGFENFSLSRRIPRALDAIKQTALMAVREAPPNATFRVSTRRADKRFALTSMELDRIVGAEIAAAYGLKVNLEEPEFVVSIEILRDAAYVAGGKIRGAGGLPVGIAGRGLVLLSGGIDSPVAAYRMMRRGLRVDFIHFHSHPLVSRASIEKASELAAHLTRYESRSSLMLASFADIQREIVARAPRPFRVVLYRRFMMRIASAIADRIGAQVIVTGESLGQVASQTLENMTVIEQAVSIPLFRPLVGMDKNEIVAEARRLGTFETSIQPDQDCCSLFVPSHPATRTSLKEIDAVEKLFDIGQMVGRALSKIETRENSFPERAWPQNQMHRSLSGEEREF